MRHSRLLTVAATAAMSLAGGLLVPGPVSAVVPSLDWGPCPDGKPDSRLQCATLDVPLDYSEPGRDTISVAVSRLPTPRPSARRGVLFVNPGGQGFSHLTFPQDLVDMGLPASVSDAYDIVMMDPRGIGRSTPVTCDLRPEQAATLVPPPYAVDEAAVDRRAVEAREIAEQCARSSSGARLPYMTIPNVARDMESVRKALGEQKISYLGFSNGTHLGTVYDALFPGRTDRVVLDGVSGLGGLDAVGSRRFAVGFETRFPDFARWAAERHDEYGLGRTPRAVRAKYFELASRLDATPVGGVDGVQFRFQTFNSLFGDAAFPSLASLWQSVDAGIAPRRAQAAQEWDFSGMLHLICNKPGWSRDIDTYKRNVARDRVRHPMFGAAASSVWPCAFWPVASPEQVPVDDHGPSNFLLVNNLRDPGTPYVGAVEVRRALKHRSRLVSVDQGGHLSYIFQKNGCANAIASKYLATGERPKRDTFCPK